MGDVVLERVYDLVPQYAIGFAQARGDGHDDAAPQRLGDAANPVIEKVGDDVGLDEARMTAVEDERLTVLERVTEDL